MIARKVEGLAYRVGGAKALGRVSGIVWPELGSGEAGRPTVLAVTHDQFLKDLAEIDRLGRFNIAHLPKRYFGRSLSRIVPRELQLQRRYYGSLAAASQVWDASGDFGVGLLKSIGLRRKIDAVLSAHIDYWQDEGLRRACTSLGIPFLSVVQENYNIPATLQNKENEYRDLAFRFGGTAIATFSEHMREMFIRAGVCDSDRIVVTGPPRFDGWRRTTARPGKRVVLFSFQDSRYYVSGDLFGRTMQALEQAIPADWEFIIRCKNEADHRAMSAVAPARARLDYQTPLHELLSSASTVVGSNSLGMVEALLSSARLIIATSEAQSSKTSIFDPSDALVAECLTFSGPENLPDLLRAPVPPQDSAKRQALLGRYVHYSATRSASENVADFIGMHLRNVSTAMAGRAAAR